MTTAVTLLNRILSKLRRPTKATTTDFTSFTDFDLMVLTNMQMAQDLLILDLGNTVPRSLIGNQAYASTAIGTSYLTPPVDLLQDKITEFYRLDSSSLIDGLIPIVSDYQHVNFNDYFANISAYVYLKGTYLYFSKVTTILHSFQLRYVKQPTALNTYDVIFSFPAEFENCLVNKAIALTCIDLDINKAEYYEQLYQKYLAEAKFNLMDGEDSQLLSDDSKTYYLGTW